MCKPAFEPLESADLKILSLKMVILVALTMAKRVSDIHTLMLAQECMRFSDNGCKVWLKPNMAFVPENLVVVGPPVEQAAYHPPPFAFQGDKRLHCLCSVRGLRLYRQKTCLLWSGLL